VSDVAQVVFGAKDEDEWRCWPSGPLPPNSKILGTDQNIMSYAADEGVAVLATEGDGRFGVGIGLKQAHRGIQISDGRFGVQIAEIAAGGAAEKARNAGKQIRVGDYILFIDGWSCAQRRTAEVAEKIVGEEGTQVTISIARPIGPSRVFAQPWWWIQAGVTRFDTTLTRSRIAPPERCVPVSGGVPNVPFAVATRVRLLRARLGGSECGKSSCGQAVWGGRGLRSRLAGAWQWTRVWLVHGSSCVHTCASCVAALTLGAGAGACWIKCSMPAPHGSQAQKASEVLCGTQTLRGGACVARPPCTIARGPYRAPAFLCPQGVHACCASARLSGALSGQAGAWSSSSRVPASRLPASWLYFHVLLPTEILCGNKIILNLGLGGACCKAKCTSVCVQYVPGRNAWRQDVRAHGARVLRE